MPKGKGYFKERLEKSLSPWPAWGGAVLVPYNPYAVFYVEFRAGKVDEIDRVTRMVVCAAFRSVESGGGLGPEASVDGGGWVGFADGFDFLIGFCYEFF